MLWFQTPSQLATCAHSLLLIVQDSSEVSHGMPHTTVMARTRTRMQLQSAPCVRVTYMFKQLEQGNQYATLLTSCLAHPSVAASSLCHNPSSTAPTPMAPCQWETPAADPTLTPQQQHHCHPHSSRPKTLWQRLRQAPQQRLLLGRPQDRCATRSRPWEHHAR